MERVNDRKKFEISIEGYKKQYKYSHDQRKGASIRDILIRFSIAKTRGSSGLRETRQEVGRDCKEKNT